MTRRKLIIGLVIIVVLLIGWYLFRPELLFIDKTVSEEFPGGAATAAKGKEPLILTRGSFRGLAHETKGIATIYQLADGKRTLRLTQFETSNGPDVRVYLVASPDASESVTKAGFIDLGAMKGNKGDQNYDLPADADLKKYQSVSIWCRRFGVNFGAASLKS